jgi:hypothetical protein
MDAASDMRNATISSLAKPESLSEPEAHAIAALSATTWSSA